jgi:hypothetical protein
VALRCTECAGAVYYGGASEESWEGTPIPVWYFSSPNTQSPGAYTGVAWSEAVVTLTSSSAFSKELEWDNEDPLSGPSETLRMIGTEPSQFLKETNYVESEVTPEISCWVTTPSRHSSSDGGVSPCRCKETPLPPIFQDIEQMELQYPRGMVDNDVMMGDEELSPPMGCDEDTPKSCGNYSSVSSATDDSQKTIPYENTVEYPPACSPAMSRCTVSVCHCETCELRSVSPVTNIGDETGPDPYEQAMTSVYGRADPQTPSCCDGEDCKCQRSEWSDTSSSDETGYTDVDSPMSDAGRSPRHSVSVTIDTNTRVYVRVAGRLWPASVTFGGQSPVNEEPREQ